MNHTVRVAILGTRGVPARYGGFETFAEELGHRLTAYGHHVTVYCEATESAPPDTHRGIHLVYKPAPAIGSLSTIWFDMRCLWHARNRYDIVYMLGYGAAWLCWLPRLGTTRVWINVDGIEWARSKWHLLGRLYFRLMEKVALVIAHRTIADAVAIREHLLARHGDRHAARIAVIPYGAPSITDYPAHAIHALGLVANGYYLVVCRLEPENHVLEIATGFLASPSPRILIVVGNHTLASPYVRSLTTLAGPRIRFLGAVYDPDVLRTLRFHCYAYCHGHSVGGTNPSLLEALGCGNAVIAHDNPFNREVADGAAAYFTAAESVVDAIRQLESSETLIASLRTAARSIMARSYDWNSIADTYAALVRDDIGQ